MYRFKPADSFAELPETGEPTTMKDRILKIAYSIIIGWF
jgi:hypothetical protein